MTLGNLKILTKSFLLVCVVTSICPAQGDPELAIEKRIIDYLKENVKPGERVIVSELINKVFTSPEEKKVLNRLYDTFFKIPLFVAQYKASTNQIPALADISRQFNLPVEGEASVLLSIIDSDPRVPKFIKRDPKTGEITEVDVEAVKKDRRFGQILERTLMGWPGKDAPPFTLEMFDGKTLASSELKGKNYLIYFWFSGCPPCVKIAPHLVDLHRKFESRNFTIVSVNADRFLELKTTDAERSAYLQKVGFKSPVTHLNKKMQEDYGNVMVYPTLFLVNSRGVVQKHYVNYQPLKVLADDVETLLKAEQASGQQ
jgi:thiol-disulfide isomerase/thioredoxin